MEKSSVLYTLMPLREIRITVFTEACKSHLAAPRLQNPMPKQPGLLANGSARRFVCSFIARHGRWDTIPCPRPESSR